MDILTLKRYRRTTSKADREFLEFYINDNPLSELIDDLYYSNNKSILDNWIGVLGASNNPQAEIIKVKQLQGKVVSDKEIRDAYPADWNDDEFQWYLEKHREELSDPEVLLYYCPECGDYECGGIAVIISQTDQTFIWTLVENGDKQLRFEFEKYTYYDVLSIYYKQLLKQ